MIVDAAFASHSAVKFTEFRFVSAEEEEEGKE